MKNIFVAMPFVSANDRDQQALTKFFDDYIKYPIENDADLRGNYLVRRSADDFAILDQIILDLVNADIVICDLSGAQCLHTQRPDGAGGGYRILRFLAGEFFAQTIAMPRIGELYA